MGYVGLTIGASDTAHGMACSAFEKMVKSLRKDFKEERRSNEFNTSGAVNLAMFFEKFVNPCLKDLNSESIYCDGLTDFVEDALGDLQEEIKGARKKSDWDDEKNRLEHLERYLELRKVLQTFLRKFNP
jgi:hypothetical protein